LYKFCNPGKLGNLQVKNRIVRSATYMGMATESGEVTDKLIDVYCKLAEFEIGLITTGFMYVSKNGKAMPRQVGVYDDSLISGLKNLVMKVKDTSHDVKIFAQIAHVGRQVLNYKPSDPLPIAPSAIKDKLCNVVPKEMTKQDIKQCINDFIQAAKRIYYSEFDGVQLHCAHGYLLSEFISPYCNRRTDEYGGSTENRFRIVKEILLGIQDEIGKNFPVSIKLNVGDFVADEPQLKIDESKIYAKMLTELGIAAIETSGGLYESAIYGNKTASRVKINKIEDEAYFLNEAKIIKNEIGATPVILVGGIRSVQTVESVLNEGIDFIAISRPLIREPDLIIKWINNISNKSECISCNRCLLGSGPKGVECQVLKKSKRRYK